jgi:hypothetical protein
MITGVMLKGDYGMADPREVMKPWHIDSCYCDREGPRGAACPCPPWRFDTMREIGQVSIGESTAELFRPETLGAYLNSLGEWYDRGECTDFARVMRADLERVAPLYEYTLSLVEIHYF